MSTVAITGLVLAAVVAERREAEETLQQLNAVLEQRIDERTVQLRASNAQLQNEVVQRQQAQRRLEESQAQLRQLSAYLETSREQERAEMAREIHDELGQQLTGLKMDLLHLNKTVAQNRADALRDRIRSMSELLDNTIQTVRRVASSLRPAILDDFGLLAALEWQLQEFQKRTGISCRLDSAVEALELEPESTTALFRVCQEALTNVARHAQATAVEVTVEVQDAYLVVQIKDNGQGIAPHKLNNHQSLGLVGMRERVRLIGGTWEINGTSGTGTTIRVTVPWPQGQPSTFDDERSTYQD
jgi:signal transduction histidine kinase